MAGKKKRQSVGRQGSIPSRGPRTHQGFPRWLTLDNHTAAAELRHQCEDGTVPVPVFTKLLERGYREPPEANGDAIERRRMIYLEKDENPFTYRKPDTTSETPRTTQMRSFTLGNPVVRRRLQQEWEDGTMHPTIRKWFIEHGRELLRKQTDQKPLRLYWGAHGKPWDYDVMKEQEAAAIADLEAQKKTEALRRQAPDEEQKEPAAGKQEADEGNVLEVYVPEEDRA
jgi:hypothetical protein